MTPSPEARAARDALLRRAQWIIDSNIRAACGLQPVLPPDLLDFASNEVGAPSIASLNGLLKSVMPAIDMSDDRKPMGLDGTTAIEQAEGILAKLMSGDMSLNEADASMSLVKDSMSIADRGKLLEFISSYSEKHNIQLKSF